MPAAEKPNTPTPPGPSQPAPAGRDVTYFAPADASGTAGAWPAETSATSGSSKRASLSLPKQIGPFEIRAELGRGGMGIVYQAFDTRLQREVALKVIHGGIVANHLLRARFRAEAETAARLMHPQIVQVFEIGEWMGQPYLTMELVDGESLKKICDGRPLSPERAAEAVAQLAEAMQYAHDQGVIHRDLKPANILQTAQGALKIMDFGLAKSLANDQQLTRTGDVLGTPSYMAPEQATGDSQAIGARTDVYALGALLYELLTGRPPFQGANHMDTLRLVCEREPVAPTRLQPQVPQDLETICLKSLQKKPGLRYLSAADLAQDLRRFLHHRPIQARRASLPERLWKWALRHPTTAALILVSALALICLAGVGVVSLANANLHAQLRNTEVEDFRNQANARCDTLKSNLDRGREVLYSLAAFYDASLEVDRAEFAAFTAKPLGRHKFIRNLQWVPRVQARERPAREAELQAVSNRALHFYEFDTAQQRIAVRPRPEYWPCFYINFSAENADPNVYLGFDHDTVRLRSEAMRIALQKTEVTASELTWIHSPTPEPGFLLYLPISQRAPAATKSAGTPNEVLGFVVMVFSLRDMIETIFKTELKEKKWIVQVIDVTNPEVPRLIHPEDRRLTPEELQTFCTPAENELMFEEELFFAERLWRVLCRKPRLGSG